MSKDEIITQQAKEIAELKQLLSAALLRIEELETRLKSNSENSHRPPSSDGLKKQPAFPRQKGGKRGAQPGHQGNTLKAVGQPDQKRLHAPPEQFCSCGCPLKHVHLEESQEKRQVFDLPAQLLEVTEHRVGSKVCPDCGQHHIGQFPQGVSAPVQYGSRVRGLISFLNVEQSLPVGRVCDFFESLTGYTINENTVTSSVKRMADDLSDDIEVIKAAILAEGVAHADETGARVAGKLHWVHVLSTKRYTYFFAHQKRGIAAMRSPQSITAAAARISSAAF